MPAPRLEAAERQVANRQSALAAGQQQQAAATAQTTKANVRLTYTEITAASLETCASSSLEMRS